MMPVVLSGIEPLGRNCDPESLASQTIQVFTYNCRLIRAAADAFDVPVIIIWQPALAAEAKVLDPLEAQYVSRMDPLEVRFQQVLWDSAGKRSESGLFHWLGDVNRGVSQQLYMDYCHMNSIGTGLVAEEIASLSLSKIEFAREVPGSSAGDGIDHD
jgi:hypothetical protein